MKYPVWAVLWAALFFLVACGGDSSTKSQLISPEEDIISDSLPITIDSLRNRAMARTQQDSLVEALQDIDFIIEKQGLTVENGIPLAEVYLMMGNAEQAQRTLYSVMESHPEDAELFTAMARLFLIRENYMMCHNYAAKAYGLDNTLTMPVFYDGLAYGEEGEIANAINCFSNVLLVDPHHYDAMIQLGLIYSLRGDPLAMEYLQSALEEQPNSTEALHLMGLFCQETGLYTEALDSYNRILQISPDYIHALFNSGFIHMVYLENYDTAVMFFDEVITLQPEYVDALYNLGFSYELNGDFVNARKYYRRVLEINSDYVLAIQGIQRVRP